MLTLCSLKCSAWWSHPYLVFGGGGRHTCRVPFMFVLHVLYLVCVQCICVHLCAYIVCVNIVCTPVCVCVQCMCVHCVLYVRTMYVCTLYVCVCVQCMCVHCTCMCIHCVYVCAYHCLAIDIGMPAWSHLTIT